MALPGDIGDGSSSSDQAKQEYEENVREQREQEQRERRRRNRDRDSSSNDSESSGGSGGSSGSGSSGGSSGGSTSTDQRRNALEGLGSSEREQQRQQREQSQSNSSGGSRSRDNVTDTSQSNRQTYSDIADPSGSTSGQPGSLDAQQGVESDPDFQYQEQSRELERRAVEQAGLENEDQVAVSYDEETGELRAELTETGEQVVRERARKKQRKQQRDVQEQEDRLRKKLEDGPGEPEPKTNSTGSFVDTNQQGEGVVRDFAQRAEDRRRDALEGIGSSEREQARYDIAQEFGVDTDEVVITGRTDDGRFKAAIESPEQSEQFGDFTIKNPVTGNRVEDELGAVSNKFMGGVEKWIDTTSDYNPYTGQLQLEMLERGARAAGRDDIARDIERLDNPSEQMVKSINMGAASVVDVAGTALGVKEGVEFAGYAAGQDGGKTYDEVSDAAEATGKAVQDRLREDPITTVGTGTGMLIGSLAGSTAIFKVASSAGRVPSAVARYSIQPGEEIASGVATKALGRTSGGRRVLDKIPGGRIDNEEIAIAAARRAKPVTSKLARDIRRTKYDVAKRAKEFAAADRAQANMAGLGRRTTFETDTETNQRMSSDLDRSEVARQDLEQTKYELDRFAEQEQEVVRGQLDDVQSPEATPTEVAQRDRLTVDTDELDARRLEMEQAFEATYDTRGRTRGAGRRRRELRDGSELQGQPWVREAAEMQRRAQSSSFEMETELEQRPTTRAELSFYQRPEDLARQEELPQRDMLNQFEQDQLPRTDQRTGIDTRVDYGTEYRTEVERRMDSGYEAEWATETETEWATETESEYARELENRFRSEWESEVETEPRQRRGNQQDAQQWGVDVSAWENTWRTGIADIDTLWRRQFGGR